MNVNIVSLKACELFLYIKRVWNRYCRVSLYLNIFYSAEGYGVHIQAFFQALFYNQQTVVKS